MRNLIYYACNPLILIETMVSGHNDIVMACMAVIGIILILKRSRTQTILGYCMIFLATMIKGATGVLFLLPLIRKWKDDRIILASTIALFLIFGILGPLREELYPWYAIWFLSMSALLPYDTYTWVREASIVFSFGLSLRYIPYIAMGYYEGVGPIARTVITIVPVILWMLFVLWRARIKAMKNV